MITLDDLTLPGELIWTDEFSWRPMETSESRAQSGRLTIQRAAKIAGRPVTLELPSDCITYRPVVLALQALLGRESMTLTLHDGRALTVTWRHGDGPMESPQLFPLAYPDARTPHRLTLRLQTL